MANLVAVEAGALLAASSGQAAYTAPTAPVKIALTTTVGTATAAGTEVTGGSYARQTITYNAPVTSSSPATIASSDTLTYTGMPATSVQGVDEYDSAGAPVRRWTGPLAAAKTTNAGDTFTISAGNLTKSLG